MTEAPGETERLPHNFSFGYDFCLTQSIQDAQTIMVDQDSDVLQHYYEQHHLSGKRLRQSFLEIKRTQIFSAWLGQGKKILDLGCRDGTLTHHFMKGNQITGGDIDVQALNHATKTYGFETYRVNLNQRLPFDDNTFDAVILAEVLEHLPYPDVTLAEIARVLRPDGKFIGNVPLAYHLKDRYQVLRGKKLLVGSDKTHLQYFSYDDLLILVNRFFAVREIKVLKGDPWAGFSLRLFARNVAFMCSSVKQTNREADPS